MGLPAMISRSTDVDYGATILAIAQLKKESAELDHEIDDLMVAVRKLQFLKLENQKRIRQHQGLITLARRVPPEILATIFELCVEEGFTRTPLSVSHVCSEWRRAAATARVWSHVYVNLDSRDPVGRTSFWLLNAQHAPLTVTVDVGEETSHLDSVMGLLVQRAEQWTTFNLKSVAALQANKAILRCRVPLPQLRRIYLSVGEEAWDLPGENLHEVSLRESFALAKNLRTLCITRNTIPAHNSIPVNISHLSINIQWMETEVTSSVEEILNLLEHLPTLEVLSITSPRGQSLDFVPDTTTRVVTALALRSLTMASDSVGLFGILPKLITPNLTALTLRHSAGPSNGEDIVTGTGSKLCLFVERSCPPLELLDLNDIDLSEEDLRVCLRNLPNLQDLRLHDSELTDAVLERLSNLPEQYCPRLNSLDVRWCSPLTGSALVKLVTARAGTETPLRSLSVLNCARVGQRDIIALAQFVTCRLMLQESGDYCRELYIVWPISQKPLDSQLPQGLLGAARMMLTERGCKEANGYTKRIWK